MNTFSTLWTIKLSDWQRALVIAIVSTPLSIIYDTVLAGSFTFDWKAILRAAVVGGISYFGKNFLTGANGNVLTNSPKSLVTGGIVSNGLTPPPATKQ